MRRGGLRHTLGWVLVAGGERGAKGSADGFGAMGHSSAQVGGAGLVWLLRRSARTSMEMSDAGNLPLSIAGFTNPAKFVDEIKCKPAPQWGFYVQLLRGIMDSLLLYLPFF